jgi:hypothetical protein
MKSTETLEPGFYFIEGERCYYFSGKARGNKWIDLRVPNPKWMALMWTCISVRELEDSVVHATNPIHVSCFS